MNAFHSSGMPIGSAPRMFRWKSTMTATAAAVRDRSLDSSSTAGTVYSTKIPVCASAPASPEGRRSSGNRLNSRRLIDLSASSGLLLSITETTNGKCLFSFEVAAPHQSSTSSTLAATIMSRNGRKNSSRVTQ